MRYGDHVHGTFIYLSSLLNGPSTSLAQPMQTNILIPSSCPKMLFTQPEFTAAILLGWPFQNYEVWLDSSFPSLRKRHHTSCLCGSKIQLTTEFHHPPIAGRNVAMLPGWLQERMKCQDLSTRSRYQPVMHRNGPSIFGGSSAKSCLDNQRVQKSGTCIRGSIGLAHASPFCCAENQQRIRHWDRVILGL